VWGELAAFPEGEPAEGAQQPLRLVLSLCVHPSKKKISENTVCVCLGVLAQAYISSDRERVWCFFFEAKGKRKCELQVSFVVLKSSFKGEIELHMS